jgi:hypothetical protein
MRRLRLTPRRIAVVLAATVGISAGVAYAATLSVTSWKLWAGSQALTKATCTLTGTAQTTDAQVVQATANTSNTTGTTMLVKSNAGSADWSFVLFNLSSCAIPTTGGADSATLTLFITTAPSSRTITVTPVLTSWLPSPTWNTAQTYTYGAATTSFTTGATGNTARSATVTVDVDALIKNSSANFGWRLSDTGTGSATTTFATSENVTAADRPKLVINYEK